jgi:hypothetical protein
MMYDGQLFLKIFNTKPTISSHNISKLNCKKYWVFLYSDLKWACYINFLMKNVNSANFGVCTIRNAISREGYFGLIKFLLAHQLKVN